MTKPVPSGPGLPSWCSTGTSSATQDSQLIGTLTVIPIVDNECFASGFWRSPQHEAADHSIGFLTLVVCGPGR